MQLLRVSGPPLVLACVAGGILTAVGSGVPVGVPGWALGDVGYHLLVLGGSLLVALLWGGVYLEVREASRGHPGLRSVGEPALTPERTAELRALEKSLSALGFRPDGWFSLDDFARTHVRAWRHESRPAAAFLLYFPGGPFRLRFVRRFASGGVLVSSTRVVDLSYPPPQGVYVQVKKGASVDELWAWHLDGEALFPDATGHAPGDAEAGGPRGNCTSRYRPVGRDTGGATGRGSWRSSRSGSAGGCTTCAGCRSPGSSSWAGPSRSGSNPNRGAESARPRPRRPLASRGDGSVGVGACSGADLPRATYHRSRRKW